MSIFSIWVIVMISLILLLAITLFIPNFLSSYRELRKQGVTKPTKVIRKEFVGYFLRNTDRRNLTSVSPIGMEELKNISVWLSWDIRWVSAGKELGRIIDIGQDGKDLKIKIQNFNFFQFTPDGRKFKEVIFKPHNQFNLVKRSRISSIYGLLEIPDEEMRANIGEVIKCILITL